FKFKRPGADKRNGSVRPRAGGADENPRQPQLLGAPSLREVEDGCRSARWAAAQRPTAPARGEASTAAGVVRRAEQSGADPAITLLAAALLELRYGRVVEAVFTDHNGFRKARTAVILTPTPQIASGQRIVLMAITGT